MTRRRTQHEREIEEFYSRPTVFGPEFKVGVLVTPAFASNCETLGEGKVTWISNDRTIASVEFAAATVDVEPWDIYLKETGNE